MTRMNQASERRVRRSSDPVVALHFQLAHTRIAASLDALVVADGAGVVVAGAGSWAACEELAAFAPFIAAGDAVGPCRDAAERHLFQVRSIDFNGEQLLLCAQAPLGSAEIPGAHDDSMERAARGVSRILEAA